MSKKLTEKSAPVAGRNCDIGLATSDRFLAKGDFAFVTHRRRQELNHAANRINQNDTLIQGDIAGLSDLDLINAASGTAKGPPLSFNATQDSDFSLDLLLGKGI